MKICENITVIHIKYQKSNFATYIHPWNICRYLSPLFELSLSICAALQQKTQISGYLSQYITLIDIWILDIWFFTGYMRYERYPLARLAIDWSIYQLAFNYLAVAWIKAAMDHLVSYKSLQIENAIAKFEIYVSNGILKFRFYFRYWRHRLTLCVHVHLLHFSFSNNSSNDFDITISFKKE